MLVSWLGCLKGSQNNSKCSQSQSYFSLYFERTDPTDWTIIWLTCESNAFPGFQDSATSPLILEIDEIFSQFGLKSPFNAACIVITLSLSGFQDVILLYCPWQWSQNHSTSLPISRSSSWRQSAPIQPRDCRTCRCPCLRSAIIHIGRARWLRPSNVDQQYPRSRTILPSPLRVLQGNSCLIL